MQINSPTSNAPNPNFGIACKEFTRADFKPFAKELEGRVGIHCLKTGENVRVVFATVPHSPEENDCLVKYGAKHITPIEAENMLDCAVDIVQKNFGKLLSEVEVPFLKTKKSANPYGEQKYFSKGRIEGFLGPKKS